MSLDLSGILLQCAKYFWNLLYAQKVISQRFSSSDHNTSTSMSSARFRKHNGYKHNLQNISLLTSLAGQNIYVTVVNHANHSMVFSIKTYATPCRTTLHKILKHYSHYSLNPFTSCLLLLLSSLLFCLVGYLYWSSFQSLYTYPEADTFFILSVSY